MLHPVQIYRGDTWIRVWTIAVDGVALNLTGASAALHVRSRAEDALTVFEATTAVDGGLTITEPTAGIIGLRKSTATLPVGRYIFDLEITLADGTIQTYEQNYLIVRQDVTRIS